MDAGRVAARALAGLGITQVAGVAGESFLPLLEGLREEGIPFLTTATEAGAAFLAIGHARTTGRPGFLAVTRGPGAANALIGVHEALQSEVPIVMIVGQIDTRQRSRQVIQEMEIAATFAANAKVVVEVSHPERIGPAMVAAYRASMASRRGPVVLSIPADMLRAEAPEAPVGVVVSLPSREVAAPTDAAVTSIVEALRGAQRPLIVLGRPFSHHAHAELARQLAHAVGAGVVGAHACADPYDTSDPQWLGCSTVRTSSILGAAIEEADVILLLGHQMNDRTSQSYRPVQGRVIGVRRIPPTMWDEYPESENHCADPIVTLRAVIAALGDGGVLDTGPATAWVQQLRSRLAEQRETVHRLDLERGPGFIPMTKVVAALDVALPARATIVPDVGTFNDWFTRYLPFPPGRRYLGPTGNPMGFGLPAAIGVQAASDLPRTVVLVGDGGFLMSLAELATLARLDLPVTVIVFVNGVWGSIARDQDAAYGTRFGTDLGLGTDFAAVASAFGVPGRAVVDTDDLPDALAWALGTSGPSLLTIRTDPTRVSSADLAP